MPIELPDLDDKTYAELVEEARAALVRHAPDWTDHNPSDPGIALVELLAWLTELLIYRTGRIPEARVRKFLALLDGPPPPNAPPPPADLGEATRSTLSVLRERWRAVTPEDYESLALYQWPDSLEAASLQDTERHLARVCCLPERVVTSANPTAVSPGEVSLVVLQGAGGGTPWDAPRPELLDALAAFLRERRIITTRLHVSGPRYVTFDITATLKLRDDARAPTVRTAALQALTGFFDPRTGGRGGDGWPFGREVPASEVYATLDGVPGVESVEDVRLQLLAPDLPDWRTVQAGNTVLAFRLYPHELPRLEEKHIHLKLQERRGDQWMEVP